MTSLAHYRAPRLVCEREPETRTDESVQLHSVQDGILINSIINVFKQCKILHG